MAREKIFICLVKEKDVAEFIGAMQRHYPDLKAKITPGVGHLRIDLEMSLSLEPLIQKMKERFESFFLGNLSLEKALHHEMIQRNRTLAFAESCTGGALASKITAMPGASSYFLGSMVVYSDLWKERFLQVSRTTLKQKGAVSKEVVTEMAKGLLKETEADFVAVTSGIAGPDGGSKEKPVGTVFVAIGERDKKIDAGVIHTPQERELSIETASSFVLAALWRKVVHQKVTFS